MMKIIFLDAGTCDLGDVNFSSIEALGDFIKYDFTNLSDFQKRIADADILIVNKFKINKSTLTEAKKLKYIIVAATGYNNIDLSAVNEYQIAVSNVRAYSTNSVAQQVFASLLAVLNKSESYFHEVNKGRWKESLDFCFLDHSIEELAGKSLGIAGYGDIGKKIALIAQAFDMKVQILQYKNLQLNENIQIVSKEKFFESSDIITLHLPLNADTNHFINKKTLESMKEDAILINTGRGGLINEEDLMNHLLLNNRFKAILDVISLEPPRENNPLIGLPNAYITPHIAWASRQARQRLIEGIAENIKSFLKGQPKNVVNQIGLNS